MLWVRIRSKTLIEIHCELFFFSLGYWYGAKLIREEGFSIGSVIIVSRFVKTNEFRHFSSPWA